MWSHGGLARRVSTSFNNQATKKKKFFFQHVCSFEGIKMCVCGAACGLRPSTCAYVYCEYACNTNINLHARISECMSAHERVCVFVCMCVCAGKSDCVSSSMCRPMCAQRFACVHVCTCLLLWSGPTWALFLNVSGRSRGVEGFGGCGCVCAERFIGFSQDHSLSLVPS